MCQFTRLIKVRVNRDAISINPALCVDVPPPPPQPPPPPPPPSAHEHPYK